ncbi:hypothetical protein F7P85_05815 [Kerstersia gyiorum]|uniref:hypothetical protein n=1 Tax=Kerstersia gyiorum TaxID=206506 RepID=UPI00102C8DAD|nr:hypothetical protein [Kerstersia gyiorum]KAB0544133.1 hypothetical protein F7P85_05815 [Kerstersia gyiorum]
MQNIIDINDHPPHLDIRPAARLMSDIGKNDFTSLAGSAEMSVIVQFSLEMTWPATNPPAPSNA